MSLIVSHVNLSHNSLSQISLEEYAVHSDVSYAPVHAIQVVLQCFRCASSELTVVLVVGIVELPASLVLGLLPVDEVKTLGLDLAVDEGTREASQELLRLSVARGLAILGAVPLVSLGSLVGRSASNQLVRELSLVGAVVRLVLVVGLSLVRVAAEPRRHVD